MSLDITELDEMFSNKKHKKLRMIDGREIVIRALEDDCNRLLERIEKSETYTGIKIQSENERDNYIHKPRDLSSIRVKHIERGVCGMVIVVKPRIASWRIGKKGDKYSCEISGCDLDKFSGQTIEERLIDVVREFMFYVREGRLDKYIEPTVREYEAFRNRRLVRSASDE